MKNGAARKLSDRDYYSGGDDKADETQRLFVTNEGPSPLIQQTVHSGKRFRGDILIYFIAVGLWLFGTVWMVIKLVDKFF